MSRNPRSFEISIKENPSFATNKKTITVNEIVVNGVEVVKAKRAWWKLFGQKYHLERKEYKKTISIDELVDGDTFLVFEVDYCDRYFYKGKIWRLEPQHIDVTNYYKKENKDETRTETNH